MTQGLIFQGVMTCTKMFIVALLIMARNWEKPSYASIIE